MILIIGLYSILLFGYLCLAAFSEKVPAIIGSPVSANLSAIYTENGTVYAVLEGIEKEKIYVKPIRNAKEYFKGERFTVFEIFTFYLVSDIPQLATENGQNLPTPLYIKQIKPTLQTANRIKKIGMWILFPLGIITAAIVRMPLNLAPWLGLFLILLSTSLLLFGFYLAAYSDKKARNTLKKLLAKISTEIKDDVL